MFLFISLAAIMFLFVHSFLCQQYKVLLGKMQISFSKSQSKSQAEQPGK